MQKDVCKDKKSWLLMQLYDQDGILFFSPGTIRLNDRSGEFITRFDDLVSEVNFEFQESGRATAELVVKEWNEKHVTMEFVGMPDRDFEISIATRFQDKLGLPLLIL